MHQLERLVLSNWGRLAPQDIELRGMTAILGPTGAGKSTIVDAVQLIVTGSNSRYYDLNKSTGGRNARSIRDYCLGADDHVDPDRPARDQADALLAMCFRDQTTGTPISIGLIYSADRAEPHHDLRSRFVAPGYAIQLEDFVEIPQPGKWVVPPAARLLARLKERCPTVRLHGSSAAYVDDYLHAMRPRGAAPHSPQVLRNFKESIAFQPIDDPTAFVRKHILEEDFIEVEALKGSIERYRYLESEVRRREQMLEEIGDARRRMQTWAQHLVRGNIRRFTAAYATRLRLAIVTERLEESRRKAADERAREERFRVRNTQAIEQLENDILRARSLLTETSEAVQLRGLDAELSAAETVKSTSFTAINRRVATLAKLSPLTHQLERLPIRLHDAVKAIGELQALVRGRPPESFLLVSDDLASLERRAIQLLDADAHFERQLTALDEQVGKERARLDELEERLKGEATGQALSRPVNEFRRLLQQQGIESRPLPDLVEVSEPTWAMAVEMLLGANREALLVPADQLSEAYRLLYEHRRQLHACRLVDVRKTARPQSRLSETSLGRLIVTDDEDARVFIERQIGRYAMAETDADLAQHDHAVTRRGKTTAGMALRVFQDITPILGKTAQRRALEAARQEFEALSETYKATFTTRSALMAARNVLADLSETAADELASELDRLETALGQLRGAKQARDNITSPEAKKLHDEIAGYEAEIRAHRDEIKEDIEPRIRQINDEDIQLQVQLLAAQNEQEAKKRIEEASLENERQPPIARLLELLPDEERLATVRTRIENTAGFVPEGKDPAAILADMADLALREGEPMSRLGEESVRRGRSAYQAFIQTHLGQAPPTDTDVAILEWCIIREKQLEYDELRQFRQQFEEARRKMEMDLTEGLINRLSDKFQKAKAQIDRLNRNLAGRTFTGQTYMFRSKLNDALKPIHALAEAVSEAPRQGLSILEGDAVDPKVAAGFRDLERRLSDEELVKDLRDYRRFFDFDLHMKNERGQETTLSKRSVTGSGGQKQAPYYVAVGAALAAAYYPKSAIDSPDGFGLVVFDEAFNNLDAPNTRALLDFFRDLHLQVVVAAPDKVRAMFLENADTIVSVNRRPDNQEPMVRVTHPSARARDALASINPVNLGIEHYRDTKAAAAE